MDVFSRLSINEKDDLVVHSGLGNLKVRFENGAKDAKNAILETVAPKGTVIMPSHSGQLTDPYDWTKYRLYIFLSLQRNYRYNHGYDKRKSRSF